MSLNLTFGVFIPASRWQVQAGQQALTQLQQSQAALQNAEAGLQQAQAQLQTAQQQVADLQQQLLESQEEQAWLQDRLAEADFSIQHSRCLTKAMGRQET